MGILIPQIYSQTDSRWAELLLGFNTNPKYNFHDFACLVTCLSMVARYYGKNETPITINQKLKDIKPPGYVAGGGDYIHDSFQRLFKDIEETQVRTPSKLTDAQLNDIRTAIDAGYPVIVQLDYNPKTVALDTHFVLLTAYNPNDENDFTIADPLGGTFHSLKDYLGWVKPSVRNTIEQYIIYKGKVAISASTGCLLANDEAGSTLFEDLVHGSGEWDKTVQEFVGPDVDPKGIDFDKVDIVVNGHKARVTYFENQLKTSKAETEAVLTELANQRDKVINIEKEHSVQISLKDAEIEALQSSGKLVEKLKEQYLTTITNQQEEIRQLQIRGGEKDLEISDLKVKLEQVKNGPISPKPSYLEALLAFLAKKLKR